jgi:hypothetical protein
VSDYRVDSTSEVDDHGRPIDSWLSLDKRSVVVVYARVLVEPGLLQLQHMLGQDPSPTSEEQEFIMVMHKTWEEGRAEARAEGRTETQANAVLAVLRVRGIAVPDAARERIWPRRIWNS